MKLTHSNQAEEITICFGGAPQLHRALKSVGRKLALTTVYRWAYKRSAGGTGGVIPPIELAFIKKAAERANIAIPAHLLVPVLPQIEDKNRKAILS